MQIVERHLDTVDSTNTWAKQHLAEFPTDALVCVTAEEQTAGRGRFQRKWMSPKGVNLYATFVFRLPKGASHLGSIGQTLAVSFASVLLQEGLHPNIKWPNDVRLEGKKIAGILAETILHPQHTDVVLGIGVNVNMAASDLERIDQPATSLREATGRAWDRTLLLKRLQDRFLRDLALFKQQGFAPFHHQFENLLALKGQTIRVFDGKREWIGVCHSITSDGQLNLYLPTQEIHTISAGDIKNS